MFNIPEVIGKVKHQAIVVLFMKPFGVLESGLRQFVYFSLSKMRMSGSVGVLENRLSAIISNEVSIVNGDASLFKLPHLHDVYQPQYIGHIDSSFQSKLIGHRGDKTGYDFYVLIPDGVSEFDVSRVTAIVSKYKLCQMTFKISSYGQI